MWVCISIFLRIYCTLIGGDSTGGGIGRTVSPMDELNGAGTTSSGEKLYISE